MDWPEAVVGALAVVNAVGDGFTGRRPITGGPPWLGAVLPVPPHTSTTWCGRHQRPSQPHRACRLDGRADDAIAACLRPAHTRYDGDAVFTVSCGEVDADPDALGEAAFEAVGRAIEAALRIGPVMPEAGWRPYTEHRGGSCSMTPIAPRRRRSCACSQTRQRCAPLASLRNQDPGGVLPRILGCGGDGGGGSARIPRGPAGAPVRRCRREAARQPARGDRARLRS